MSCDFVAAKTCWKSNTAQLPSVTRADVLLHQRPRSVFYKVGNLDHGHSRFDRRLCILSDLSVHFTRTSDSCVSSLGIGVC